MGHIGNDKSFQDLPLTPPDYDFELKIAFCCLCFSKTVYEYKAKNQMATPDVEAQGPQSTVLPEQNQMATPDFTPHRLQCFLSSWKLHPPCLSDGRKGWIRAR